MYRRKPAEHLPLGRSLFIRSFDNNFHCVATVEMG
nr:MAG TPA: hypothetical protein [Caudoviricetes sp.]